MSEETAGDVELDETDLKLLEHIESDFDVSLETLSDHLDLSKSAVHYRLNKLQQNGVVTGVTADLDPLAFGLEMVALTQVTVVHESGYSDALAAELSAVSGVERVYYTMGDVDFVLVVRVQDREQMNDVIEEVIAIEGVTQTSSSFVMDEAHDDEGTIPNLRDDAVDALLDED